MGGWDENGHCGDGLGDVEWIQLAKDGGRWWAVVNEVSNIRVQMPELVS
jgi:hypothetical protein